MPDCFADCVTAGGLFSAFWRLAVMALASQLSADWSLESVATKCTVDLVVWTMAADWLM